MFVPSRRMLALVVTLLVLIQVGGEASVSHAQPAPPIATLRGSEKGVLGPFELSAGLAVVRGRSNGAGNFAVWLVMPAPGQEVVDSYDNRYLMMDSVGAYNGASGELLRRGGTYYFDVTLASGPYELSVEQPRPETVSAVDERTFSGRGQQVTRYFRLPAGAYTVNAENDSTALRVWLYRVDDLGGYAVVSPLTGYAGDRLMDTTIPPSYMSVPIDLPEDGIYILYVASEGTGSRAWKVSIE